MPDSASTSANWTVNLKTLNYRMLLNVFHIIWDLTKKNWSAKTFCNNLRDLVTANYIIMIYLWQGYTTDILSNSSQYWLSYLRIALCHMKLGEIHKMKFFNENMAEKTIYLHIVNILNGRNNGISTISSKRKDMFSNTLKISKCNLYVY